MRSITCYNKKSGIYLTMGEDALDPFILAHLDGVYSAANEMFYTENTMVDGGTYQGSVAAVRNIIITLLDNPNNVYNQGNRDILYTLFRKDEEGTLVYTEGGSSRKINYYVESIERESTKSRPITISLICPDPMWSDVNDHSDEMGNWINDFEFIHEFVAEGEELGHRSLERSVNIINTSAANNIGIEIIITVSGSITNPSITRVESDESIKIGSSSKPFTMQRGDILRITTGVNDKHVYFNHKGQEAEVNEYLTEDSEFIQLMYGDNHISYAAEDGEDYMSVEILYSYKYEGA